MMNTNLFDKKRKYKKAGLIILAVAAVIIAIFNVKFQSTDEYRKEQQRIANEYSSNNAVYNGTVGENATTVSSGIDSTEKTSDTDVYNRENMTAGTVADEQRANSDNPNGIDSPNNNPNNQSPNAGTTVEIIGDGGGNSNVATTAVVTQQESTTENNAVYISCTIMIVCDELSNNLSSWTNSTKNPAAIVPTNGIIMEKMTVTIKSGSTVLEILKTAVNNTNSAAGSKKITVVTKLNSDYVESINQLAEKDAGGTSGWMYSVNGDYPKVGASSYIVKSNDKIIWEYSVSEN